MVNTRGCTQKQRDGEQHAVVSVSGQFGVEDFALDYTGNVIWLEVDIIYCWG